MNMFRLILAGILVLTPLAGFSGEPSSRVAMSPDLLQRLKKAEPEKGSKLAASCAACHDAEGVFPALDGQLPTYLYKQLMDYKDGHRADPVMSGLAATLSDDDMIQLAAYYSQKAPKKTEASGDNKKPVLVVEGDSRRILPPCAVCHDSRGTGQKIDVPALAGQSEAYLTDTLKQYKSGERHNDLYGRMRSIAKEMTDEEIRETAHYYAGMGR